MSQTVFVFVLFIQGISSHFTVNAIMFHRMELCGVHVRLSNKCMEEVSHSESIVKCCVRCARNDACVGASWQTNSSRCYLHGHCNSITSCMEPDDGFAYFQKRPMPPLPCVRGTWDESTSSCQCTWHYVGHLCDRQPHNCTDLVLWWPGYMGFTILEITLPQLTKSVAVVCSRTESNLTTTVARNAGEISFKQSWHSYVHGFYHGFLQTDISFFTGLEAIRLLMGPSPRNLRIKIRYGAEPSLKLILDRYTGVVIGDSSTNYLLRFAGHTRVSGTGQGSCLELSNMTSFSTWDADHDGDLINNWAMRAGAGWWFPAKNIECNPLGSFYTLAFIPAVVERTQPTIPAVLDDGYVRFPGASKSDVKAGVLEVELIIEEEYV